MDQYSLDTNICSQFANGDSGINGKMAAVNPADIVICSVVRAELLYGARNSGRPEANLTYYRDLLGGFQTATFDDRAAEHYAVIRSTLRRLGTPIGANDMMIAAIALANDHVVVTRNDREFLRVDGLRVEVW